MTPSSGRSMVTSSRSISYSESFWTDLDRIYNNLWIPRRLHPITGKSGPSNQQLDFLLTLQREAFYGGAAGGGKSDGLLMGAAMYVDEPGYNAIILRKEIATLRKPGGLIPRSHEWGWGRELPNRRKARWDPMDYIWRFPSGATVGFGYLSGPNDYMKYMSTEYQYIGFDELPEIRPFDYRMMSSRLRRTEDLRLRGIPLRMRSTGNPVGPYVLEVKTWFNLPEGSREKPFISATIDDNIYLDKESYIESLMILDPVTRARMLEGDWTIRDEGGYFQRDWFPVVDQLPNEMYAIRYWDKAAVKDGPGAFTAGVLVATSDFRDFYLIDVRHFQGTPLEVRRIILQTSQLDERRLDTRQFKVYGVAVEQEPGSSGVEDIETYRFLLRRWPFYADKVTGSKEQRATIFSSMAQARQVHLYVGNKQDPAHWDVNGYLDELATFPQSTLKDRVDASSGAINMLIKPSQKPMVA